MEALLKSDRSLSEIMADALSYFDCVLFGGIFVSVCVSNVYIFFIILDGNNTLYNFTTMMVILRAGASCGEGYANILQTPNVMTITVIHACMLS